MHYLVDADTLAYLAALEAEGTDAQYTRQKVNNYVDGLLAKLNVSTADVTFFISGENNFRYKVYPGYKHNRRNTPKPTFLKQAKAHLEEAWNAEVSEGWEADDSVAIEVTKFQDADQEYCIVSIDKDLDQLYGPHYNPRRDIHYYVSPMDATYNFYYQLLVGDTADGIPGVFGIGPEKAGKLLSQADSEEGWFKIVADAYGDMEVMSMYAKCLWLLREPNEVWEPKFEATERKEQRETGTTTDREEDSGSVFVLGT